MIKAQAFSRLMDLDLKIQESSEKREEELAKIDRHYRQEKQEIILSYTSRMEEEVNQAARQIIKQGEEKAETIKNKTKENLQQMENDFAKYQDQMVNEVLNRIFEVKRENHG